MDNDLDQMLSGYLEGALFSSPDDDDRPLDDNYSRRDIAVESLLRAETDCADFLNRCNDAGIEWWNATPPALSHTVAEVLGHDFWLTRNHHGAGFWDGDWAEHGDALTEICRFFPEVDPYVGDDGQIYLYQG